MGIFHAIPQKERTGTLVRMLHRIHRDKRFATERLGQDQLRHRIALHAAHADQRLVAAWTAEIVIDTRAPE